MLEMTRMDALVTPAPAAKLRDNELPVPDIGGMLNGLSIFAELWASVSLFLGLDVTNNYLADNSAICIDSK